MSGNLPSPTFTPFNNQKRQNIGRNFSMKSKSVLEKSNYILNKLSDYFNINQNAPKTLIYFDVIHEDPENDNNNNSGNDKKKLKIEKSDKNEGNEIYEERKNCLNFLFRS